MRYEAMRLLQFLFSLTLIVGAFAAGVLAGWYRWAPRTGRPDAEAADDPAPTADASDHHQHDDVVAEPARSPLFSPEGEGWGDRWEPVTRVRSVVLSTDNATRRRPLRSRGELPRARLDDADVIDLRDATLAGERPASHPPTF